MRHTSPDGWQVATPTCQRTVARQVATQAQHSSRDVTPRMSPPTRGSRYLTPRPDTIRQLRKAEQLATPTRPEQPPGWRPEQFPEFTSTRAHVKRQTWEPASVATLATQTELSNRRGGRP